MPVPVSARRHRLWLIITLVPFLSAIHAFLIQQHGNNNPQKASTTVLSMGLINSLSKFLESRKGDFVKLEETETFGPGPALILFNVPSQIDNEEIQDMLLDAAPLAFRTGVRFARIGNGAWDDNNDSNSLLSCSVQDALHRVVTEQNVNDPILSTSTTSDTCPVLYFSGFDNTEMMATYNIIGKQIFLEIGRTAACAKAVPKAMSKPFKQVLEEISADHLDAITDDLGGDKDTLQL